MKKHILWLMVLIIFVSFATVVVSAAEFDWRKYEGTELNIFMCKHPYAEGVLAAIPEFEALTGIKVNSEAISEDEFFDKSMIMLSAGSKDVDVLMAGVMQLWTYAPAGYIEPLEGYIADSALTNPDYDFEDIFERLREGTQWDTVDGHPVGTGSQWAIPLGFEQMALIYRADLFEKYDIKVPNTYRRFTKQQRYSVKMSQI